MRLHSWLPSTGAYLPLSLYLYIFIPIVAVVIIERQQGSLRCIVECSALRQGKVDNRRKVKVVHYRFIFPFQRVATSAPGLISR